MLGVDGNGILAQVALKQQDEEAEVNTEVEVVKVEFKPVAQN
mgnify:CR=1 FL=1